MTDHVPLDHLTSDEYENLLERLRQAEAQLRARYLADDSSQPGIAHTHLWDGKAHTLPLWLTPGHYHFDNDQLVIHTPDRYARPESGWLIVHWTDDTVTVASPTLADRVYGPDGLAGRIARAEQHARNTKPATAQAAGHVYLSTGCFHGDHAYCQSMTGLNGAKRPASCKFCQASCRCECHTEAEQPVAS